MQRERIYIVCVSPVAGGKAGADRISGFIDTLECGVRQPDD